MRDTELKTTLFARGGKKRGDEIKFRCPYPQGHKHGDKNPSASYNEPKNAWNCPVCNKGGSGSHLAEVLGIKTDYGETQAGEPPVGIKRFWFDAPLAAWWVYKDHAGKRLGVVARYDKGEGRKDIIPFFNYSNGVWMKGAPKENSPLFGLNMLSAHPEAPVVVVEGEKCAQALHRYVIIGITSQGGSNAAAKANWKPLEGRDVVIWPDNDVPGEKYARDVVGILKSIAKSVTVLDISKLDMPIGGDVVDWLSAHPNAGRDDILAVLNSENTKPQPKQQKPVGILLSEVEREDVHWLWRDRFPLGKLTVIDGDPGLGKSTLTLDLAARVSTGKPMPDDTPGVLGGVVLLTAEDGLGDTVRPRLEAHGANLDRVLALPHVGEGEDRRPVTLPADLGILREAIQRIDAVLVVIDPLMAFLDSRVNSHRDQDVRRALAALADLAEETGAAVVIVRHLNKTAGGNPMYRGGGSIGIIGAARAAFIVAKHPKDDERRVLAATKANLCRHAPSLEFVLDTIGDTPRVRWLGTTEETAETLLAINDEPHKRPRDEAAAFLREVLSDGPVAAKEVPRQASEAGFNWSTVRRAAESIGVEKHKHGQPGQKQEWQWSLPKMLKKTEDAHIKLLGTFEENEHLRNEVEMAEVEL